MAAIHATAPAPHGGRQLGWSAGVLAVLGIAAMVAPPVADGCSGPLVTVEEARADASAILLVRTAIVRGDPNLPSGYAFVVEEAFRGDVPALIEVEAPQFHACGDRISAAVGDRLVVAFEVHAFVGQPPMNPYWRVLPDGRLNPEGIDATAVVWQTLDDLRTGLGGPGGTISQPDPPRDERPPTLVLLIGLAVVVAFLIALGGLLACRRG